MTVQISDTVRNAAADAIETAIGASPVMTIRTGAQPSTLAASDSGTLLATIAMPSDWLTNAAAGVKAINGGPWQDTAADGTGLAGHFRIKQSSTTHIQGSVSITGGGGDLQMDNPNLAVNQQVSITVFNVTVG